jgi:two-component system, OmpR family, phosphate regulon response regulator PhoB
LRYKNGAIETIAKAGKSTLRVMSIAEPEVSVRPQVDAKLVYVVDDESMIGDVVQLILKMDGFRPRFFLDPETALQAIAMEEPKPVLLLTDFLMSPINGMELIVRSKQCHPDLKTILYSGNANEDSLQNYGVEPDGFLRKPFLPKTLLGLVRFILNPPRH